MNIARSTVDWEQGYYDGTRGIARDGRRTEHYLAGWDVGIAHKTAKQSAIDQYKQNLTQKEHIIGFKERLDKQITDIHNEMMFLTTIRNEIQQLTTENSQMRSLLAELLRHETNQYGPWTSGMIDRVKKETEK